VNISSLVDNWLLLRNVETNGERNRLLFVLKSRGTAHSNQVREFVLTDHGVELVEVYIGPAGMLAGSARLAQEAVERDADLRKADDLERHLRDLRSSISERQAHLIAARDQLVAEQTEIDRIDSRERRGVADTEADRVTMASRRWADAVPADGGKK
jgi:circadian clock protein KaiC